MSILGNMNKQLSMIYTGLFFEVLQSRLMESQKKDPPLENLTREKPKLTGTHLILYHGTDDNGGNDIALKGISIHSESRYHDFGRRDESHAFYLTPCRKLAEKFAMERALNNNRDRCAIVTIEVPVGPDVKHYQFEDVEEWRNFVNYNRSRDVTKENKEKAQEIFRKGDDIISGWISMHVAGETNPCCYDVGEGERFYWQYAIRNKSIIERSKRLEIDLFKAKGRNVFG